MRLKAIQELGIKEVPVIKASELTEDEQREFIIKDNVGFGEWDFDMLFEDYSKDELSEWGVDTPEDDVEEMTAKDDEFDPTIPVEIEPQVQYRASVEIDEFTSEPKILPTATTINNRITILNLN